MFYLGTAGLPQVANVFPPAVFRKLSVRRWHAGCYLQIFSTLIDLASSLTMSVNFTLARVHPFFSLLHQSPINLGEI